MTRSRNLAAAAVLVGALVGVLSACGSAPGTTDPEGVDGLEIPTPSPAARDFVAGVDNPYLPLAPGSTWTYEGTDDRGPVTVRVVVEPERREVAGLAATAVRTEVRRRGVVEVVEDWYAQDRKGNVWHLGTEAPSPEESWEAGVAGAQAGVVMLAEPRLGDGYREELADGVADDVVEVRAIDAEVVLDTESYDAVVETEVTSALAPGRVELRSYAPGIGLVLQETVAGGDERLTLVAHRPG